MPAELVPLESEEHVAFVRWLELVGLRHHHSPNETGRSPEMRRRASRVKQQGTSPGFPDLLVLVPPARSRDGQGHLLCVEMKRRKGGTVSPEQRAWLAALNAIGPPQVDAVVAHGAAEAIQYVRDHLVKPLDQPNVEHPF